MSVRTTLAALLLLMTTTVTAAGPALRMQVQGSGGVTIVFESGLGDTFEVWRKVQSEIADGCARTVSYTRAGYAGSDAFSGLRDAKTIVSELRTALHDRGLDPPYVLVGHSLGGLYMQYFARNFPDEVKGLLLVDATHWEHMRRLKAEVPGTYRVVQIASMLMLPVMRRELADSLEAGRQVLTSPASEGLQTIVLSSTRAAPGELPSFRALAARMQDEIAAEYSGSRHVRVERSAHYIQRDRPDVVISAARELAGCQS